MNIMTLLDMALSAAGEQRIAVGPLDGGMSYRQLYDRAGGAAQRLRARPQLTHVVYAGESSPALPVAMFASAWGGVPFVPLNYRLADDRLRALVAKHTPALVIHDEPTAARLGGIEGAELVTCEQFVAAADAAGVGTPDWPSDPDDVAVLLHTSGTSGTPKAAILRQRHLTSYVLGSVEFLGATEDEATLVSVPPYHIAGVAAILTSTYGGRRLVQLPAFSPEAWVASARRERITHAMTVPTMLARILDHIDPDLGGDGRGLPDLRHIAYGGGRMPLPVIERALRLLPHVEFVNAYGLTETSSSIAVLTAEDHRTALDSEDPGVRNRLGSVGRPLPGVEITVRDLDGNVVGTGVSGEIWVRGEQVSGEYHDVDRPGDDGWFRTNDGGSFDEHGYLYVEGRLDDVIVRGGENLSPGEIEDVLLQHPAVSDAVVFGAPDEEWGEVVHAVVVLHDHLDATPDELASWTVAHLRSSRRPARVEIRDSLPMTETGKVLRRVLRAEALRGDAVAD
jgi:fatty-acyl-CoA synthase